MKNLCEECRFSSGWEYTKHDPPRVNKNYVGKCDYFIHKPKPVIPKMMGSEWGRRIDNLSSLTAVPGDEKPCPLWEEKLE